MKNITLAVLAASTLFSMSCARDAESTLYVGTYGGAIHILSFDAASGEISAVDTIPAVNASYLCLGADNTSGEKVLFAVSENDSESGAYSFARDREGDWRMTAFSDRTGEGPCFILSPEQSDVVLTGDYSNGSFTVLGTADGVLSERLQQEKFESVYDGNVPFPGRQDKSHIHQLKEIPSRICASLGLQGRYMLVTDLGNDLIHVYRFDGTALNPVSRSEICCGAGSGPRHMEFDIDNNLLYCISEISGEIIVWKICNDGEDVSFDEIQRLTADGNAAAGSADIHLHPSGKWLYTSHRLKGDGISVMAVNADGTLVKTGYRCTGGHPRSFIITPDGKRMLVACRDAHSIQVYSIDGATGMLSETFSEFNIGEDRPVCLVLEQR